LSTMTVEVKRLHTRKGPRGCGKINSRWTSMNAPERHEEEGTENERREEKRREEVVRVDMRHKEFQRSFAATLYLRLQELENWESRRRSDQYY
jgi:DNA-binding transcriptional regulator YiaG